MTEIFGILNKPLLAMDAFLTPERCEVGLMIFCLFVIFLSSIPWNMKNDDIASVGSAGALAGALGGAYALWMFISRTGAEASEATVLCTIYAILGLVASALGAWAAKKIARRQRKRTPSS